MEVLPSELCHRIFSLLDYRQLSSAALVCRNWNSYSAQADLWQQLYIQRWGEENAASFSHDQNKSWKAAYETRDRSDRVGLGTTITREGTDYFLVHKGEILSFLGSCRKRLWPDDSSCQQPVISFSINSNEGALRSHKQSDIFDARKECGTLEREASSSILSEDKGPGSRVGPIGPCKGLLDQLIFFVGDLECSMRESKRNRVL